MKKCFHHTHTPSILHGALGECWFTLVQENKTFVVIPHNQTTPVLAYCLEPKGGLHIARMVHALLGWVCELHGWFQVKSQNSSLCSSYSELRQIDPIMQQIQPQFGASKCHNYNFKVH